MVESVTVMYSPRSKGPIRGRRATLENSATAMDELVFLMAAVNALKASRTLSSLSLMEPDSSRIMRTFRPQACSRSGLSMGSSTARNWAARFAEAPRASSAVVEAIQQARRAGARRVRWRTVFLSLCRVKRLP